MCFPKQQLPVGVCNGDTVYSEVRTESLNIFQMNFMTVLWLTLGVSCVCGIKSAPVMFMHEWCDTWQIETNLQVL